jgi:WhiB family redox-sensing transcriptional regulator
VWFPLGSSGVAYAKRLCATCDVQVECLDYALANRIDYGVWGGESERSRRRLLRDAYGVDVSIRQGVDGADGLADV